MSRQVWTTTQTSSPVHSLADVLAADWAVDGKAVFSAMVDGAACMADAQLTITQKLGKLFGDEEDAKITSVAGKFWRS